jgi:hypothetical protein
VSQFTTNRLMTDGFSTIQTPSGTYPVAGSPSDVLTLTSSDGSISIVGNAITDTIDFTVAAGGGAVTSVTNTDGTLSISPSTGAVVVDMANSGVTAGSYLVTGATIDAKGRVTAATDNYYITIVNALIFG